MEEGQTPLADDKSYFYNGRFRSPLFNLYGLFQITISSDGIIEAINYIISTFSDLYEIEPHTEWDEFLETINHTKWEGNFNSSITNSVTLETQKLLNDSYQRTNLFQNIKDYNYDLADITLHDLLKHTVRDKELILDTNIQEVSAAEIAEKKQSSGANNETTQEPEKKVDLNTATIIPVSPILAPVKGKPLYELRIGEKIMVRILPESEKGKQLIESYELKDDNGIKPVPGEVIDIKADGPKKTIIILVKLKDNIFGKCEEEQSQIKFRLFNPGIDKNYLEKITKSKIANIADNQIMKNAAKVKSGFSSITIIVSALFTILLIIFLIIVYFSI